MALLYRFTKLNDRHNTGIFTFIVTRSVTRDLHRDATTKDFYYGYHRWAISFQRANDRALGVYLILRNASPHTECYADYTLTLLNREHFSRNETHSEKQCKFTVEKTTQGVSKWILLSEIQSRKFGDETGEFLLELSLGNIMTIFETNLQVSTGGQLKSGKFESTSFSFGSFDWSVSIVIHNYGPTGAAAAANTQVNGTSENHKEVDNTSRIIYVFLNRLSGFEHPCRVQYRVVIGEGKNREDSAVLDQISDVGGRIRGFQMGHPLPELLKPNGAVRVYVELHCCNAISEAKVPVVRNPSPSINCYDRNKQGWCIEADMESEFVRLKLFFMDLHSVPRNHLRYISWIAYVIARDPKHGIRESIAVANSPHSNYYIQDGIDMGANMDTKLPVAKIKESPKVYLENDKCLTVHVEWCDSIMLFNHIYHKYDDISRTHCHQMRREIIALTNENLSLEKQLLSYQKSIGAISRSLSKDGNKDGSETGSLRGSASGGSGGGGGSGNVNQHIGQRSASEVHLPNDVNHSTMNHLQQQQLQQQQQLHSSSGANSQSSIATSGGGSSGERRSASGSGGSGSMLGLVAPNHSNPLSPAHSPLLANNGNGNSIRNSSNPSYHQSFHQLPRVPSCGSQNQQQSVYHHQLPSIPPLQASGLLSSSSSGHGSPQHLPGQQQHLGKHRGAAHYGSLPIHSNNSTLDYEDSLLLDETGGSLLTVDAGAIISRRSMHRSRERIIQSGQQFSVQQQQQNFALLQQQQQPTFGQSLNTVSFGGGGGGGQSYPTAPPTSPHPLYSQQPNLQQQQQNLSLNGWSGATGLGANGSMMMMGQKLGGVTFFDHM